MWPGSGTNLRKDLTVRRRLAPQLSRASVDHRLRIGHAYRHLSPPDLRFVLHPEKFRTLNSYQPADSARRVGETPRGGATPWAIRFDQKRCDTRVGRARS